VVHVMHSRIGHSRPPHEGIPSAEVNVPHGAETMSETNESPLRFEESDDST
jgi:hypothetical protein